MKVLVTGGAGFIGSHIVDALVGEGADVIVLDSLADDVHTGTPAYLNPAADLRVADLRDAAAVADAVKGADAVCHQAARVGLGVDFGDVVRYVDDNDAGTATLLRALWQRDFSGRLVVASSMVVYGEGRYVCATHGIVRPQPRTEADLAAGRFEPTCVTCRGALAWTTVPEDAALDPRNVYAATKLHTEQLALLYGRESGAQVCALRYHNVYGPRMPNDTPYAGVGSILRSAYEAGQPPQIFEDGMQLRDFVHVADVARANLLALDSAWTGAVNVASGEPHTVLDLALAIQAGLGSGIEPQIKGRYRLGDVRHIVASPLLALDALGFKATTPFAEGVAAFSTAPLRAAFADAREVAPVCG